jgi:hypothetical protein
MNKSFYYFDQSEVQVGDYVLGAKGRKGRVVDIIQPNTKEAVSYEIPKGGVVFEFDWSGENDCLVMTLPDGIYWEDIEFLKRG